MPPTRRRAATLISITTFVVLTLLCGGVAWKIEQHERDLIQRQTQLTANQIAIRMEEFFTARLAIAETVRDELADGQITAHRPFVRHVMTVTDNFPGLQAINWVNEQGIITWVAPIEPNRAALGKNLLENDLAGPYLRQAMETGESFVTGNLELLQGGDGFAAYVPVPAGEGSLGGYINLVARTQPMLDVCLARGVNNDFDVIIMQGGDDIYAT